MTIVIAGTCQDGSSRQHNAERTVNTVLLMGTRDLVRGRGVVGCVLDNTAADIITKLLDPLLKQSIRITRKPS